MIIPQIMMKCNNVSVEIGDEDNLRSVDIPESEGSHDIGATEVSHDKFKQPIKLKKVNIGTLEVLKFGSIRY